MSYQADSFQASAIWGRIGAAVMAIISMLLGLFGYTMDLEDQASGVQLISALFALVAGVMAYVSKIRESKKIAAAEPKVE
jgi:uncharacterized membrane protein